MIFFLLRESTPASLAPLPDTAYYNFYYSGPVAVCCNGPLHLPLSFNARSWPKRQVRDDHSVRLASRLVQYHNVGEVISPAERDNIFDDRPATIDPLRVGEDQPHLLGKLFQPAARVPSRGH